MPVLLLTKEETDIWMNALWEEAQRPARALPNDSIMITLRKPYGSTIIDKAGELLCPPEMFD